MKTAESNQRERKDERIVIPATRSMLEELDTRAVKADSSRADVARRLLRQALDRGQEAGDQE